MTYGLVRRLLPLVIQKLVNPMPQEISVSYQAIKSKVYRLIDALVVGEKNEVEVQESVRRWWELIHPADRPIAQKYLLAVLERSRQALGSVEEGLTESTERDAIRPPDGAKHIKLVDRIVKPAAKPTSLSTSA
jgi:hypothetical protein